MLSSVLCQKLNVGINIFTFSFNTKLHVGQVKSTFLFSDRDFMKMPIMMCLNVYLKKGRIISVSLHNRKQIIAVKPHV